MQKILKLFPRGNNKLKMKKKLKPIKLKDELNLPEIFKDCIYFGEFSYHIEDDILYQNIEFNDFKQAMCFINNLAILADKVDHYPDLSNENNFVQVIFRTRDCEGTSVKDFFMAHAVDKLIAEVSKEDRDLMEIVVEDWEKFLE